MKRMKKVAQRGGLVLQGLLIVLLGVVSWNYPHFSSMQIQVTSAPKIVGIVPCFVRDSKARSRYRLCPNL